MCVCQAVRGINEFDLFLFFCTAEYAVFYIFCMVFAWLPL